jgi:hypothetical protein
MDTKEEATLRESLRIMTEVLNERLATLEEVNDTILERTEDLQLAAVQSRANQARFVTEHERMMSQVDGVMATVTNAMNSLTLQIRDLRSELKKSDPE